MFKRIALFSTLASTLVLSGCVTAPFADQTLPEPRPETTEASYAMKVATQIQTTARCIGCKDTVLWHDEKYLADKVGFNPMQVVYDDYREADKYYATVRRLHREKGKLTKEDLPPAPKVVLNNSNATPSETSDTLTTSLMLADSFDGIWSNSNSGASLGVGLALGLLGSSLKIKEDENLQDPATSYMKAVFVLPPEDKITYRHFQYPQLSKEENEYYNVSAFASMELVRQMTKSAVEMGYKPVGDIRVWIMDDGILGKPEWWFVYQPIENDAIGCPKITEDMDVTDMTDMCRIEFGFYNVMAVRKPYTFFFQKEVVPEILGGDGKTERWLAHFGYNYRNVSGLRIDEAKSPKDTEGERNYRFAMGLQKYLKPGQFVYVPAYEIGKDKWSPQCVLDNKGVHYFSVVVPQNRPVTATPVAQEPEQTSGMSGWLNKAKSAF